MHLWFLKPRWCVAILYINCLVFSEPYDQRGGWAMIVEMSRSLRPVFDLSHTYGVVD